MLLGLVVALSLFQVPGGDSEAAHWTLGGSSAATVIYLLVKELRSNGNKKNGPDSVEYWDRFDDHMDSKVTRPIVDAIKDLKK